MEVCGRLLAWTALVLLAAPVSARAQADSRPDAPPVLALAALERRSTVVTLARDDYLAAAVDSKDVLLALRVFGPNGVVLAELTHGTDAPKQTALIAAKPGAYRVEVASLDPSAGSCRFTLTQRRARPEDTADVAGWQAFNLAEARRTSFIAASTELAIQGYRAALREWCRTPCAVARARTWLRIGDARLSLGESAQALDAYAAARSGAEQAGDRRQLAAAWSALSAVHLVLGRVDQAHDAGTRALTESRAIADAAEEASALNAIGDVEALRGDTAASLVTYAHARDAARRAGSRRQLARAHLNIGYSRWDLSEADEALAEYGRAATLWKAIGDPEGEARTLNALGHLHAERGHRQQALADYRRARDLFQRMGNRQGLGISLNGLGYVYSGLGDVDAALGHYRQQAEIHRAAGFKEGEGSALAHIGRCLLAKGEAGAALTALTQGLSVIKAIGDRKVEAFATGFLGLAHEALGNASLALQAFERQRYLSVANKDRAEEAYALNSLGRVLEASGRPDESRKVLDLARSLSRDTHDRHGESLALYHLAVLERSLHRLDVALAHVGESLAIAESLRRDVASFDLRASFMASIRSRHELQVDLLMQLNDERPRQGFDRLAFEAVERARARSLLDALAEARDRDTADADITLRDRERALRQELATRIDRLSRLGATAAERSQAAQSQAAQLAGDVDRLTLELQAIEGERRAASPGYAAMASPTPLSLEDVQTRLLDRHTRLLQYFVGEQRSYVWAVGPDTFESVALPGRSRVEELVRDVRTAVASSSDGDAALDALAALVPASVRASGPGVPVLLISPDGPLHFVPFAALPGPAHLPLLAAYDVIHVPSLSTIAMLRDASRVPAAWAKSAVVFADPVFDADDPRLARPRQAGPQMARLSPDVTRATRALRSNAGLRGSGGVPRLLDSRREARAIRAVLPDAHVAMDFAASRAAAVADDLTQYRVLHFATHALVDSARPELSGIVLSLYDSLGRPQDGILRLRDIYGLTLRADLVVLSACSTAVGKHVAGEGLLGLARGFLYAGGRRVLATLWDVDDEATGEIMARFYGAMFGDGLGPAAALRRAQRELAAQPRWRHPRFWAGFVLVGDWQGAPAVRDTAGTRTDAPGMPAQAALGRPRSGGAPLRAAAAAPHHRLRVSAVPGPGIAGRRHPGSGGAEDRRVPGAAGGRGGRDAAGLRGGLERGAGVVPPVASGDHAGWLGSRGLRAATRGSRRRGTDPGLPGLLPGAAGRHGSRSAARLFPRAAHRPDRAAIEPGEGARLDRLRAAREGAPADERYAGVRRGLQRASAAEPQERHRSMRTV